MPSLKGITDLRIQVWSFFLAFLIHFSAVARLTAQRGAREFLALNEQTRIAWSLASGHGFSSPWVNIPFVPTAQQPPLYPSLLAGIFRIFGPDTITSFWVIIFVNAIITGLTAAMIFRLGAKHFDRTTGLIATTGWMTIAISSRVREIVLSALLVTIAFSLLPESDRQEFSLKRWMAMGILAGIGVLTNPSLASIFVPLLVWLWWRERRAGRPSIAKISAAFSVCVLLLVPWTIRNYGAFHQFVPIRDNFGLELWVGNHEGVIRICDYGSHFPADDPTEYKQLGEITLFENKGRIARDFIWSHPGQFVHLCLQRVAYFWGAPPENIEFMAPIWGFFSAVAMLGTMLAMVRKGKYGVTWALALTLYPLVYYLTHPLAMYRHPIEPVILLTASYGLASAIRKFEGGKGTSSPS